MLKATRRWSCEICRRDFRQKYGVDYIEAHHKTALATYSSTHVVNPKDFALLCPNCHRAVHIHMKTWDSSYVEIADALRSTIQMSDRSQEH